METISRENGILAWHFTDGMKLRDGTPLEVGRAYHVDTPIVMCERGLHASVRAIDALYYAPGETVSRVRMFGDVEIGDDKIVATDREVIVCSDATETLRAFARWCALSVAHLWGMPPVVREYLETGDESKRDAARDAAWAAARATTRAAAWAVAWAGVGDAARYAARDARAAQNIELESRLNALLEQGKGE